MHRKERILAFFIGLMLVVPAVFAESNQNVTAELITEVPVHYVAEYEDVFYKKSSHVSVIKYEDKVYTPIRQIGDIIGVNVNWDSSTNTIYIDTENYCIPEAYKTENVQEGFNIKTTQINAGVYKQIHIVLNGCLTSSSDLDKKAACAMVYNNSCYLPINYLSDLLLTDIQFDSNTLSIYDNAKYKLAVNSLLNLINTSENSIERLEFSLDKKEAEFLMLYMTKYYRYNTHYNFRFMTISSGEKPACPSFSVDELKESMESEKKITEKTLEAIKSMKADFDDTDKELASKVNSYVKNKYSYDMEYYLNHGLEGYSTPVNVEEILNSEDDLIVCHGYATIFSYFCNYLGVRTEYIKGYINNGNDYHAWNRSLIGDEWLYTDVTWNSSGNTDKYLLLSESKMDYYHDV